MKPIQLIQLFLVTLIFTLTPHVSVRAAEIDFSWWNSRYATPGVFSQAAGSYSRQAHLPDQDDIREQRNELIYKTNRETAQVLVSPGGTVVVPGAYSARAQTDFGQNHAETFSLVTGYGQSDSRVYYDERSHTSLAISTWVDQWTFSGVGLGSATVTLSASFDVKITNSPCTGSACLGVGNPVFTRSGTSGWWYRLYGSVRVFDLDVIDQWVREEFATIDVPHEVAAFEIFQQGADQVSDFFSPFPPFFRPIPNARLNPVHTNGTASFMPVAGHRYVIVSEIDLHSRGGADVDAGHTLSLNQVVLGPGLRLNSVAITNGAQFNIRDATRLTLTRTSGGEVTLSFPSTAGFTYVVEYKNALSASAWTPLATRAGNDTVQSVIDSNPSGPARFYRLRVE